MNKRLSVLLTAFMLLSFSPPLSANSRLTVLLESLRAKLGPLAVLITNPQTGQIIYEYGSELLWQSRQAPGSLLKVFVLLAQSQQNHLRTEQIHDCQGFREYTPDKICWLAPGHGPLNLIQALAHSCNDYFYHVLVKDRLSQVVFQRLLERLGFVRPYAFLLPKTEFERSAIGLDAHLQVVPAQILLAYNALFNGGRLFSRQGKMTGRLEIPDAFVAVLREGMRGAFNYGTASSLKKNLSAHRLLAKSGTGAGLIHGEMDWRRTVGWMTVFYPEEKPRLSLLVFVHKGTGAKEAAQVAAEVLKVVLKKKN